MSAECCDVMMAHSPPLFTSRNAAEPAAATTAAGLVMYQNFRLVLTQQNMSPMSVRRLSARSSNSPTREDGSRQGPTAAAAAAAETTRPTMPTRPCLIIRTDSDASIGSSSSSGSSSSDENEPTSPTRSKKKVVFADDRGLSLTHVRLMSEPSNQPPKLMTVSPYLNQQLQSAAMAVGGGANNTAATDQLQQWQLRFPQPASNYLDFRRQLDENNVSLENVIIKSLEKRIVGTVKVRNLSYDKEVFVRSTRDRWATHQDTLCTYVQNNAMVNGGGPSSADHQQLNPVTAIYDTFVFRLPLPADAASMEFAVCYKSVRFEYWDSNDGNNYRLSVGGGPLTQKQQQHVCAVAAGSPMTSGLSTVDFDHVHPQPVVHYFGSQSRANTWNVSRDLLKDNGTTAYW